MDDNNGRRICRRSVSVHFLSSDGHAFCSLHYTLLLRFFTDLRQTAVRSLLVVIFRRLYCVTLTKRRRSRGHGGPTRHQRMAHLLGAIRWNANVGNSDFLFRHLIVIELRHHRERKRRKEKVTRKRERETKKREEPCRR